MWRPEQAQALLGSQIYTNSSIHRIPDKINSPKLFCHQRGLFNLALFDMRKAIIRRRVRYNKVGSNNEVPTLNDACLFEKYFTVGFDDDCAAGREVGGTG